MAIFLTKMLPLEFSLAVGSRVSHNRKRFTLDAEGNHCPLDSRGAQKYPGLCGPWGRAGGAGQAQDHLHHRGRQVQVQDTYFQMQER